MSVTPSSNEAIPSDGHLKELQRLQLSFNVALIDGYMQVVVTLNASNDGTFSGPVEGSTLETSRNVTNGGTTDEGRIAEDTLWSKLPSEILEKVAFLSIPTLFRCRLVCRKWNDMISSSAFSAVCAQASLKKEHTLLVGLPGFNTLWLEHIFDARTLKWYNAIDLSFLQSCLELLRGQIYRRVLAAHRSVLCVSAYDESKEVLLICNPITKTHELLPVVGPRPFGSLGLVDILVEMSTKAYKIFLTNIQYMPDNSSSEFYVYESHAKVWKMVCKIPRALYHKQSLDRCSTVFFEDVLYTLWYEDNTSIPCFGDASHVLMAYDMHENVWTEVDMKIAKCLRRARLVVSNGCLLLVGALEDSYHIWEMQMARSQCVQIARMPDFFFRRMLDDPFNALIWGYGDSIFLMSAKGKPVLYDCSTGFWQRLPILAQTLRTALPAYSRCSPFQNFVNFRLDSPIFF